MALTGKIDDDSSSDGSGEIIHHETDNDCVVKNTPLLSSDNNEQEIELSGLTVAGIEEHNQNMEKLETLNHPGHNESNDDHPDDDANTVASSQLGAGLLAGISGLLLGGPILAAVAGAAAAYVASKDEGPVGNAARATGDWAVTTGVKVGEAAKEADERHGIIDRLKDMFSSGWRKVQKFEEDHKATERVKETLSEVSEKTVEFEKKHHVVENVLEGLQSGVRFLLEKLKSATGDAGNNTNS